jgi:elongation factor G
MSVLSLTIIPKTQEDAERLSRALRYLTAEDDTLHLCGGGRADRVVINGVSEQHLETIIDRLKRDFQVEAAVGRPEVVYRAAIGRSADGEMKYARQFAGRGEYAHVKVHLCPNEAGSGFVFENRSTGGAIPDEFIEAIEEGVRDRMTSGVRGCAIDDVRVDLCDGSYHDLDSNAAAFRAAASLAADAALRNAQPFLLEPIMRLELVIPAECHADLTQNLLSRGGEIQSLQSAGEMHVIRAAVRLSQLFGYSSDLRTRTLGRGKVTTAFLAYLPVPPPDDGMPDAFVSAPLKPAPPLRKGSVAVPEPDEGSAS